jgi:hypothetical protein
MVLPLVSSIKLRNRAETEVTVCSIGSEIVVEPVPRRTEMVGEHVKKAAENTPTQ